MFIDMTTTVITTTTTNDKNPFVDFPVFSALPGPCNTLDVEIQNEGNYSCMYKDKENHPTIGIGCNLDKKGAQKELEGVGADYNAVLNGSQCLNATQILTLFKEDMHEHSSALCFILAERMVITWSCISVSNSRYGI